ncbi:MAG: hypothetical protein R2771_14950 [Saprospiraceae bacterium]
MRWSLRLFLFILGKGATERFIDEPQQYDYPDRIINANKILNDTLMTSSII